MNKLHRGNYQYLPLHLKYSPFKTSRYYQMQKQDTLIQIGG